MRVILDTNVLVAALIALNGPPHHLFEAFLGDRFTLITGDMQLEEFSRVTRYPAIRSRIHPAQAGRMLMQSDPSRSTLKTHPPSLLAAIGMMIICLRWRMQVKRIIW